ncbi:MAG: hypothetical protein J6R29_05570 [Clostridia bacterium]|nr:hypothetical protein [Clostridia bacterium]
MIAISLILSGIAFFLNGFLPLINENDNNETSVVNVLSGFIVTILSTFGILTSVDGGVQLLYTFTLILGLTNLYVASVDIWDISKTSLGWFSAIVALIAIALGIYYLFSGATILGVMFIIWSLLYVAYFISRGLDVLETASNWVIMLEGIIPLIGAGILIFTGMITLI